MLFILLLFIFGLVWGSAVNVMICRNKTAGESNPKLAGKRSKCPYCGKKIAWYDNIPLLSFFLLKGRCRHCGKKISWQYPLVELGTALLIVGFVGTMVVETGSVMVVETGSVMVVETGLKPVSTTITTIISNITIIWIFQLICIFAMVGALVAIFVYDLKYSLIPDQFILLGATAAVLYNLAVETGFHSIGDQPLAGKPISTAIAATASGFLGALIASGFFFCLVYFSKEKWMGWGDVKFAIFMGLALGFPLILAGLFIAYFVGAVVGVALVIFGKKKIKAAIPFGPFLCLGTYAGLLFGQRIVDWYLKIIL